MTYPVMSSIAVPALSGSVTTSHTVNKPTIAVGDLVVLVFSASGNVTITWPSGFTELTSVLAGGARKLAVATWTATSSSSGGTWSLTTDIAVNSNGGSFALGGVVSTLTPTTAQGSSGAIDPPSLSTDSGSKDVLWAVVGKNSTSLLGALSGYSSASESASASIFHLAFALYKTTTASSEDPPTWLASGAGTYGVITMGFVGQSANASGLFFGSNF